MNKDFPNYSIEDLSDDPIYMYALLQEFNSIFKKENKEYRYRCGCNGKHVCRRCLKAEEDYYNE